MSRFSKITGKFSKAGKSAKNMMSGLGLCSVAGVILIVIIIIFVIVPMFRKNSTDNFYIENFATTTKIGRAHV